MSGWRVAIACCAVLTAGLSPRSAAADMQWSARGTLGGGFELLSADGVDRRLRFFESGLRTEVLFGGRGDEYVRFGPALDLRSTRFESLDAAIGASLLLPVIRAYPIVVTGAVGYSVRPEENEPVFVSTLAWGYRSYDFHDRYQTGFMGYASARMDLDDPNHMQISFGVELDLEAMVRIPVLALRLLFTREHPHEPLESGAASETAAQPEPRSSDDADRPDPN
ncbi:MAG: hypothetical protein AAF605_09125 [Myxococcota bacterium]